MRLVVLGSGTSFGVPVLGCECAVCRSDDPRDRRTRVAAVVEGDAGRLLIDTPPEIRLQLLSARVAAVDGVLYTHDHADHVHGIDDLRALSGRRRAPLPIHGSAEVLARIAARFDYIFDPRIRPPPGTSKPELVPTALEPWRETEVAGLPVLPLPVPHGDVEVFAYRIGAMAYVTDAKAVPAAVIDRLRGVRLLVINALFEQPHPTHLSIPEAIAVAAAVGAERTLLTHLTHRRTHAALAQRLPRGVEPASDGLVAAF